LPRVLILTASVGEGHDLPARTLAAQLRSECPGVEVVIEDGLAPMGRVISAISNEGARFVFFRWQWIWDLGFWFFARFTPTRRVTQFLLTRVGGHRLLRPIDRTRPDVIVSTYPHTMEVLAWLRRSGRVHVPVGSAITDLAAMHYWAPPGADFYLITHPESAEEVHAVAGANARVVCVNGLTAREFLERPGQGRARGALGLPASGKIVLVSGGGWGVGDLGGAVEQALALPSVTMVVCLCGHNEALCEELSRRFGTVGRVRVEGFTNAMRDWLAAADVLVHSTGGLTVLEALMQGCPPISYGWGRGHLRVNNAAYRRFELAEVVGDREQLGAAIEHAFARPRVVPFAFAELASAASVVLGALQ
jgi:processive 1,2-diacylglycerol beta-glucosyltransferase